MPLVKVSFCAWGSRVDVSPCEAQRRFLAARAGLAMPGGALPATRVFAAAGPGFASHADLIGFQEVPSVSTSARATFDAELAGDLQSIDYTPTISGLSSAIAQAHIHFAQV